MSAFIQILRVFHIVNAVMMAWPFYALVAVHQRGRLGAPLGDRTDVYMENIIKNRTIPCFVFQGTALVTGLLLIWLRNQSLSPLFTNLVLGFKFLLLLLISGLLFYVHTRLQPAIDELFAKAEGHNPIPQEIASRIGLLRGRRKRIAVVCLFCVLTVTMLGMQAWTPFPVWLTVVFLAAIAAFSWRAFHSATPYGWA